MSYERIIVLANIGSVELKQSRRQTSYIQMRVCVDRIIEGGAKESVWYKVLLFGKMAENPERVTAHYAVGRQVLVEGRPQNEIYKKGDGTYALDQAIIATMMPELCGYRRESTQAAA